MKFKTSTLVKLAMLVALSIVLTRYASFRFFIGPVEGIRIGFGSLPIMLAGFMFGPVAGGLVGGVADVLGYIMDPMKSGVYMPQFTLISIMNGIVPWLIWSGLKKLTSRDCMFNYAVAIAFAQILFGLVVTPVVLLYAFKIPIVATFIPRLVAVLIQIPLYTIFVTVLIKRLGVFMKIKPDSFKTR